MFYLQSLGILLTECNKQTVKNSNLVILAVKPNIVRNVLKELSPHLTKNHVIMSLAAGVNLKTLEKVSFYIILNMFSLV
jgi:pyrroline-5-carboxylate reductase